MSKFALPWGLRTQPDMSLGNKVYERLQFAQVLSVSDMSSYTSKVTAEDMTQPETIAHLVRTAIELPNNAAIGRDAGQLFASKICSRGRNHARTTS